MIAGLGTFSKKNLNISLCFCFVCLQATGDSAYIGKPRERCSYINHVPFQAGSHSNDNIQADLRKYLAMTSCLISAVIDLSLRSQPIKVLWSMCVFSVP